jgi:hypothetical protein
MFRHTSRLQFESKPDQPDPVYAPCLTKEHIRELQILPDLEKHKYLNFNPGFSRISRPFWLRHKNVHRTERGHIQPFLGALGEEVGIADARQLPLSPVVTAPPR